MRVGPDERRVHALVEVVLVAASFILISTASVRTFDLSGMFPADWLTAERATGSSFLIGAAIQVALVLVGAYLLRITDLRQAIAAGVAPATHKAWTIAVIATAIHIGTGILLFMPEPQRVWEASKLKLILSVVPAADGWSQEVLFRGYVLFRLARAGVPAIAQLVLSGALFAAIHFGYAGETAWEFIAPIAGTFVLGTFYALSVQSGGGSLKPVILCHVLIILALQPWLALAR
jgi:hypothetical protein